MSEQAYSYTGKMFEDYDNPKTREPWPMRPKIDVMHSTTFSGGRSIRDYRGEEIGLGFNKFSPINLIYIFDGEVTYDDGTKVSVEEFINSNCVKFELLDFKYHPVIVNYCEGDAKNHSIVFEISKNASCELESGIYYTRLSVMTDNGSYTLFSPTKSVYA